MSVCPIEPAGPERAQRLLSDLVAGRLPVTESLGVLSLSGILAQERSDRDRQTKNRIAAQNAKDAGVRAQIKALSPADAVTQRNAISSAAELLDAWRDGAVLGVHDFHSRLVSDQTAIAPALAGNLLWAAAAIDQIDHIIVLAMSFFGATLGTLGAGPPRYDAVIGPVTADVVTRLNNLHDDLLNRLDLLVFQLLHSRGYPVFEALNRDEQLALLWSGLFTGPATDGHYIEPTRTWVLARLNEADAAAEADLKRLLDAWNASLSPTGSALGGARFRWDGARWNQLSPDPVWLLTGREVFYELFDTKTDPVHAENIPARAAALLRLSIDKRFPVKP